MITVFTPTYNRRKLLERCFKSLNKQTNKKFEWLVVDDGSNDDTREYIESIKKNKLLVLVTQRCIKLQKTNYGNYLLHQFQ